MSFKIELTSEKTENIALDTGELSREIEESVSLPGNFSEITASLTFITDDEMRRLNEKYRGIGESTDVLSFPLWEDKNRFAPPASWDELPLGDIVVSPDFVRLNANEEDIGYNTEMARVVIHGVLHLLGFDHENGGDNDEMLALQEEILKKYLMRLERRGGLIEE
jgi:probable rRNA maturation factor